MTKEDLLKHRGELEAELKKANQALQEIEGKKNQIVANANAVSGAIQEVNFWIAKFNAEEPGKDEQQKATEEEFSS